MVVKEECREVAHTIMNPGVIAPSHIPRMKRTANKPPKFSQAAWHNKAMDQMKILTLVQRSASKQFDSFTAAYLIHFPTGNLWRARFCGYSKTRYESENIVPSQLNWFTERWFDLLVRR